MHKYIIGHYNASVKIIDLVSHTTNVVCVNFVLRGIMYVYVYVTILKDVMLPRAFKIDIPTR